MRLTREQVLERWCKLSAKVMAEKFQFQEAADCFCGEKSIEPFGGYQFESPVLDFIESAVQTALDAKAEDVK